MRASDRVRLGRTDVTVTRLGLGTAGLAGLFRPVTRADAAATFEAAWNHGVRFFDTAPVYGYSLGEIRTGAALGAKPRADYTLATKVGRLLRRDAPPERGGVFFGTPPLNPVFDFSYDGVMRSVEESRKRLGIERIDILHIHDPDDHFDEALSGAYRALDELRRRGDIKAVGAGMNQAEMLAEFARRGEFDCFLLAGRYTLLDQVGLKELLPLCEERGIAIIAGGVFNSGILADPKPGATYNYRDAPEALIERARRISAVCERHGVPLRAAALQFPLAHPAVHSVLVGCRSAAQVEDTVRMFETEIPRELWADLKRERLIADEAPTP
ncbi:MAG TPA: aldo/keto reductase [Candidatus Dormibacteraeota bacterium]|nr:aldo/keto reductase [Candidatus Dormibacteraeota bacterium]